MTFTIIVTGGAGFIGSAFVDYAVKQGAYVVVLDKLTYAGRRENLAHVPHSFYELVVGDIADSHLVEHLLAKHSPVAVFNFAAESHVDNSISGPQAFVETNINGTYALLQACRSHFETLSEEAKRNFRYVQVSTDEVYGSLGAEGAFTEESPIRPNSPYSATKAAADHLVRAWFKTFGLPTLVTRCSNNYGPRQFPEKLIPLMISKALSGEGLPVYGDGKNVRDWIYVDDHCAGIWAAYKNGKLGDVYNFGGHAEVSNIDLVHTLCKLLDGLKPRADGKSYAEQITFVKDRLGHDFRYAIDDQKALQELGFKRTQTFETGLKSTVEWFLASN
jgi:dTDP-glucose 4,6-dehydratase